MTLADGQIPQISVIVPTLGDLDHLTRLLSSLRNQHDINSAEIILVENSTNPRVFEAVRSLARKMNLDIRAIASYEKGVNKARNIGIKESRAEILLFLDDDCWINDKQLLSKHIRWHKENRNAFAIGGRYALDLMSGVWDRYYNTIQMRWLESGVIDPENSLTRFLIGGHVSIKKVILRDQKLRFDEQISYGGSELSLFLKAHKLNLPMHLENMYVVHNSRLRFLSLLKKLYRQGEGKAYLGERALAQGQVPVKSESQAKPNSHSKASELMLYLLNLVFWFGFYSRKKQRLQIFEHIAKDFTGFISLKRYQALNKIEKDIADKNDRGDLL